MKGNRGPYRRSLKLFWIVFSIGIFSFVSIFLAAGFGLLGKMPEFRQLENPKTNLATQIFSADKDQKSSHKNLEKALKVLRSRLYELELAKKMEADSQKRKSMVSSGDRSAKIRTYNYPQGRVTDHRINLTLYDLGNIMDGDIQKIIDELQLVRNTEKLQEAGETF